MPSDDIKTITFDDFGSGIDRRLGPVTRVANKFLELENYIITPGRKLKRRPPLVGVSGLLDPRCKGASFINGKIVTIAPAGTVVNHTITEIPVETLYFDNPELATTEWSLVDLSLFNDKVVASIKHGYNSVAAPIRISLHVWDDTRPTYVLDPACPTSWGPEYPLQPYGEGKLGAYLNYIPRLAISSDRVYISRPDGNVAFSGEGSPRIWNTRSAAEILADGEYVYWISTRGSVDASVIVPVPFYDLVSDQRYAAYVLEYCGADGKWLQMSEREEILVVHDYVISAAKNRWDGTKSEETKLTYRAGGDGVLLRFRYLCKPPAQIQSGLNITPAADVVGGIMSFEGKGRLIPTYSYPTLDAKTEYLLMAPVPNAPVPTGSAVASPIGTMPLNGQFRYWTRLLASAITDATGNNLIYKLTGKITVKSGSTQIVGTNDGAGVPAVPTNYLVEGAPIPVNFPGALPYIPTQSVTVPVRITINGVTRVIASVTDDHTIVTTSPWPDTLGPVQATRSYIVPGRPPSSSSSGPPPGAEVQLSPFSGLASTVAGSNVVTGSNKPAIPAIDPVFTRELEVGREVEVNGERRTIAAVTGDFTAEVTAPFTADYGPGVGLRDPRYRYAYEIGDTGNEWYAAKEVVIALSVAGKDDAGYLGTASYNPTGEKPVCIATMQNRLLVQFPSSLQAWGVGPSAITDMRLLSIDGQSSGIHTDPRPALLDGLTALPTINGVRLFNPTGNNKDYIEFTGVGDMLRGITLPNLKRSIWWPTLRAYLTCTDQSIADPQTGVIPPITFYVLMKHQDTKVLGWATWAFVGLTRVDYLFIQGDDLMILSGQSLYRVKVSATTFRDVNDVGVAYKSRGKFVYCDLGVPAKNKRLTRCEVIQEGTSTLSIFVNPYHQDEKVKGPPTIKGNTMGRKRVAIAAMGPGIGLEVESTDETGHELNTVAFDYLLHNR